MSLLRGFSFEFGKKLALALGQILRRFDGDLNVKIADVARTQHGHSFVSQFELLARLRSFGNLDVLFPVEAGDNAPNYCPICGVLGID